MRLFLATTCLLTLSACATTSFAPPNVNFKKKVDFNEAGHHCGSKTLGNDLEHNVDGARKLIDNFIVSYRCAGHSAADGRQWFEVPSFLATTLGAAAGAVGAGTNVAIGTTTASAMLNGGNSYYSPQQKADMYDSALDALLCIKNEAVGIDAFTIAKISRVQEEKGASLRAEMARLNTESDPEVSVSASKQYFDLVASSLLSVERVLSQRLSAAGTPFDPAGVIAQIKQLKEDQESTETDSDGTAENEANALTGDAAAAAAAAEAEAGRTTSPEVRRVLTNRAAQLRLDAAQAGAIKDTIIKLKALRPKLEECVVRAKV